MYLSSDFKEDAAKLVQKNPLPPEDITVYGGMSYYSKPGGAPPSVHREFNTAEYRTEMRDKGKIRQDQVYPLTAEELQLAKDYIARNPGLMDAVATIQAGLQAYFQYLPDRLADAGIVRKLRKSEGYKANQLDMIIWRFQDDTSGFSFLHDLLPAIACSLARQEAEARDHTSEYATGLALREAFLKEKSVFQSDANIDGFRIHTSCPFGKLATGIFSMRLQEDGQGGIEVVKGQKSGALLVSVKNYLESSKGGTAAPLHDPLSRG